MNIPTRGRPPFRADHIGSLLRPPALRQAFRGMRAGRSDDAFARVQDQCIREAVRMQEEIGLEGGDRRRIPPRLLLGEVRGAYRRVSRRPALLKFRDDTAKRWRSRRLTRRRKCDARVPSRSMRSSSCDATTGDAKITLPAPSTMHFYRRSDFADRNVYPERDVLRRSRRGLPGRDRRSRHAGCRYIQLDEVAIALLCDGAIRAQGRARGRRARRAGGPLHRAINRASPGCPADVVVGVHMCRGNFRGQLSRRGRIRLGGREVFRGHAGQPLPAGI